MSNYHNYVTRILSRVLTHLAEYFLQGLRQIVESVHLQFKKYLLQCIILHLFFLKNLKQFTHLQGVEAVTHCQLIQVSGHTLADEKAWNPRTLVKLTIM